MAGSFRQRKHRSSSKEMLLRPQTDANPGYFVCHRRALRLTTLAWKQAISDRTPPLALTKLFFARSVASPPFPQAPYLNIDTDASRLPHTHFQHTLTFATH